MIVYRKIHSYLNMRSALKIIAISDLENIVNNFNINN